MSASQQAMTENPMRTIRVEKITLNFGSGKDQKQLEKGAQLLKMITGIEAVKTITQKRIPSWGLRPGLPVGCKVTVRGEQAADICRRLLTARDFKLKASNVDQNGNVSFGLKEYIDIPGVRYDPAIGIIGLECTLTLVRPGYRVRNARSSGRPAPPPRTARRRNPQAAELRCRRRSRLPKRLSA